MRHILWLFVFIMLEPGCELRRERLSENQSNAHDSEAPLYCHDAGISSISEDDASTSAPIWPSTHPQGTLLVDADGQLWMMTGDGLRAPVSGDDTLGLIGMDESDAVRMTEAEESCTTETNDYWGPGNNHWWPVYGPLEGDSGPFVLDWMNLERRPISLEVLESWGYYTRWLDWFDGGMDEWDAYTFNPEPLALRDGTLVQTEIGLYYIVHARAFLFHPTGLAHEAGYRTEEAMLMSESRLRELAPPAFALTRESFGRCPSSVAEK